MDSELEYTLAWDNDYEYLDVVEYGYPYEYYTINHQILADLDVSYNGEDYTVNYEYDYVFFKESGEYAEYDQRTEFLTVDGTTYDIRYLHEAVADGVTNEEVCIN